MKVEFIENYDPPRAASCQKKVVLDREVQILQVKAKDDAVLVLMVGNKSELEEWMQVLPKEKAWSKVEEWSLQ